MDNYTNSTNLTGDPYVKYMPPLTRSLPVQSLLLGSILTFLFCLLVHLLLTAPYHRPLSRLNWSLQVSAVLVAMLDISVRVGLVLVNTLAEGSRWPYMLDYVEMQLPDSGWMLSEQACFYVMDAAVGGIIHITNIQFLMLLFPSTLEARLICVLLVPLAIASGGMNLTSLSTDQSTIDLGDAARNVCNSTLLLLFATALGIWGWLNRRRAWRTDGGTAAFGVGAIGLAVLGACVGFVLVKADNIQWLPCLGWAITLWQSFLAWWWWVGSGMGIGEVEDLMKASYPHRSYTRSSSPTSTLNRPSRISTLRARLSFPQRRRPAPRDATMERSASHPSGPTTMRQQPPAFLNLPVLSYLAPLYHMLRTAHLSARVIQFEQRGFLSLRRGWFGSWASSRPRRPSDTNSVSKDIELDSLDTADEQTVDGQEAFASTAALPPPSACSTASPQERESTKAPRRWRMHDRTMY